MRVNETGLPGKYLDIISIELFADHIQFGLRHVLEFLSQVRHRDLAFAAILIGIHVALAEPGEVKNGFAKGFGGTVPLCRQTPPRRIDTVLDDGHLFADFGGRESTFLPRWSTSDYDQIKFHSIPGKS